MFYRIKHSKPKRERYDKRNFSKELGQNFSTHYGTFHEPDRVKQSIKDRPVTSFSRNNSETSFRNRNASVSLNKEPFRL